MKINKILALVLSCVMLLSVLAGCNNVKPVETKPKETQGTNKPTESKPVETAEPQKEISFPLDEALDISVMMVMGNAAYSYNDNYAWKYLQERANIRFEVVEFPVSEASEKMNLLMSGGEYTDVLYKGNAIDLDQYGMDGILIPLEELIREYAPNLTALLDERNAWGTIAAPDGHVYSLPLFMKPTQYGSGGMTYWINREWLDAVGKDMPTNPQELYEVLKAFKEQDPNGNGIADEIPFAPSANSGHGFLNNLIGYFGEGLLFGDYWMDIDGQMEYLPTTEYFKEDVLKYFKKLYEEGLMAEDTFVLSLEQMRAVCAGEEVVYGLIYDSSPSYFSDEEELYNWEVLQPFDMSKYAVDQGTYKGGFAITDKCEHPEIMMAWVDFMYTEEGGRVLRNGVEGVTYKINADGTFEQIVEGFESNTYQGTLMGSATPAGIMPDLYYNWPADPDTKYIQNQQYGENAPWENGVFCPSLNRTAEEQEVYSVLHTDISAYVQNYFAECVTGIISIDDTWDDFQATLKQMKVDTMIQIQRDTYARATAN